MTSKAFTRAGISLAICGTVFVATSVIHASSAQGASTLGPGCRYDPKNDDDGLGIGLDSSVSTDEVNTTMSAAQRWNASAFGPNFTFIGRDVSASKVDLRVSSANLGATVQATTYRWCGSDHYTQDPVFKWSHNQSVYPWTVNNRITVAGHEIGHSIGADHNKNLSCNGSTAGIMFPDAIRIYNYCNWMNPTSDDVTAAKRAHNGNW